jgi:hypothetical protein
MKIGNSNHKAGLVPSWLPRSASIPRSAAHPRKPQGGQEPRDDMKHVEAMIRMPEPELRLAAHRRPPLQPQQRFVPAQHLVPNGHGRAQTTRQILEPCLRQRGLLEPSAKQVRDAKQRRDGACRCADQAARGVKCAAEFGQACEQALLVDLRGALVEIVAPRSWYILPSLSVWGDGGEDRGSNGPMSVAACP